jgi:N-methylhydantoinase A
MGFRDMLEIARQIRPALYDLQFEKPAPLIPRDLCFEVRERMDAEGQPIETLDEADVALVIEAIRLAGVDSIACCLLHAYMNPAHELRIKEALLAALPGVMVSISSDVAPESREYFRASTTAVNASVRPVVKRYLDLIESRLRSDGFAAELLVMQSNGGVMTFASAAERPVFMVESGPAAGVTAAAFIGRQVGLLDLISFDMGGTTAKAGLVREGNPEVTKDFEVGAQAVPGQGGAGRGSGYPIRTPVIELVEIGAGGGSIAWVDSGGGLRVGPQSSGADPGPACYGRGGSEPTVTDANLVLGRLNPARFLGGAMKLDVDAAHRAVERIARPLGLAVPAAANGIVEIANSAMTMAVHLITVQRGYDPRDFALVAFGGAGPLHANRLASALGVPTALVPPSPGIASALGLLATDLRHDLSHTVRRPTASLDATEVETAFHRLERQGHSMFAAEGVVGSSVSFRRIFEMRYVGQSYELAVAVGNEPITNSVLSSAEAAFHEAHQRAYGHAARTEPTAVVNLRLTAIGQIPKPGLRVLKADASSHHARVATRAVFFEESGGYVPTTVFDRYRLGAGLHIPGPAVVEELDSSTLIHPGYEAIVDRLGNLRIGGMRATKLPGATDRGGLI